MEALLGVADPIHWHLCDNGGDFIIMIPLRAGLVFFAFAFNMVDCGGILGGRLGNNVNMHAASLKKAKVGFAHSRSVLCPSYINAIMLAAAKASRQFLEQYRTAVYIAPVSMAVARMRAAMPCQRTRWLCPCCRGSMHHESELI